jgi:hypothetical protein
MALFWFGAKAAPLNWKRLTHRPIYADSSLRASKIFLPVVFGRKIERGVNCRNISCVRKGKKEDDSHRWVSFNWKSRSGISCHTFYLKNIFIFIICEM